MVTAHRSSPAPSAWGCMSSPGGRETRAGTLTHRLDGPKGLAARTRTPRSRGGYRLAGDPAPPASCSGRAQVDASPAHLAWGFLERVVRAPSLSNPGLPAGKGKGANTSSGDADASEREDLNGEKGSGAARRRLRVHPPPPWGGACGEGARARTSPMPWPIRAHIRIERRGRVRFMCMVAGY